MASPMKDLSRNMTPSLIGLIGGALATLGFFLPWSGYGNTPVSEWDVVIFYLTGKSDIARESIKNFSAIPFAFLFALPLLLALVALVIGVIGVIGVSVKNTALVSGLYGAAGIVGLVNSQVNLGYERFGPSNSYPSTTGLGLVVLNLGYFGVIVASIISLAHYMKNA